MTSATDSTIGMIKIGEAARRLGIAVETLRMYERCGLVISQRTASGQRLFDEDDLQWVACIRRLISEQGLNLEGIRRLVALLPCWQLKPCTLADKSRCPAFTHMSRPCWMLKPQAPEICRRADCRGCRVYRGAADCTNLKSLLYELKHHHIATSAETGC